MQAPCSPIDSGTLDQMRAKILNQILRNFRRSTFFQLHLSNRRFTSPIYEYETEWFKQFDAQIARAANGKQSARLAELQF